MEAPGLLGEVAPRLVDDAPALALASWLPPDGAGWPELADLGEQHRRLLARRAEVYAERTTLNDRFEAEDKARHAAQTAAYLTDEPSELPDVTPPEERTATHKALSDRTRALNSALDEFLRETVAVIEARVGDWTGDLANRREAAAEQRREAERLLAEARAEEVATARVEQWLLRNAGVHERAGFRNIPQFRFVTWAHVNENYAPPPAAVEQDGRPQLVDPPSIAPWDGEKQAAALAFERQSRAAEQEEHPERFLPDELADLHNTR